MATIDFEIVDNNTSVDMGVEGSNDVDLEIGEIAPHSHDDRYYTEAETDALLAGKSDTGHNHDGRYYTESETDTKLDAKLNANQGADNAGKVMMVGVDGVLTPQYGGGGAVDSVNGKTGTVVLDADDVGALPDDTFIPTKTSDLTNDSGFLTEHQSLASYSTTSQMNAAIAAHHDSSKADLDENGKVPAAQLPSFVDDVLEYANRSSFPARGESGKIYIAVDTNKQYRWSGSDYAEISSSLALGETSSTAYRGDRGKTAYDHSQDSSVHVTASDKSAWSAKQDAIGDLSTIRSGATAGSTAVQPGDDISDLNNDAGYTAITVVDWGASNDS